MSEAKFEEWVADAIVGLPQYLKAVMRVVEDPDVDDQGRVLAAGALMHCIAGTNTIPGIIGILGFVDDVLVLRMAIKRIEASSPDAIAEQRDAEPLFASLDDELQSAQAYLGDTMQVLDRALDGFAKINHQGHSAKDCVGDTESSTWLYDTVQESVVEQFEFDEDEVAREVKQLDKILPPLQLKLETLQS